MRDDAAARDRRGYWFPLVLLGFLLLGLLALDSVGGGRNIGWFGAEQSGQQFLSPGVRYMDYVEASVYLWPDPRRDWQWTVLVLATFVATVAWYGARARRAGATSIRAFVQLAAGGVLAIVLGHVLAAAAGTVSDPAELVTSIGLPLVLLGALAGVYWRLGPGRAWAATISLVCLLGGVCALLGWWAPQLVDPVIITAGLLGLAWWERSALLACVAGAVLAGMVIFPVGVLGLLVPAMLLLGDAITALLRLAVAPGTVPG